MKRFLVNLTFFFCFFPFLKILPIQAETQPIAGVIGFFIILFYGMKKNRYTIVLLWFMFVILGYYAVSIVLRVALMPQITLNAIAYFVPLFVFLSLYDKLELLSVKLFYVMLGMWFALGCLQYYEIFHFVKPFLDQILGFTISRYTSTPLGHGRGVVFFSQEPSAGSTSVMLFLMSGVFFHATGRICRRSMWIAVSLCLIMLLLNKSAEGMLMLFVLFIGLVASYSWAFFRGLVSLVIHRQVARALACFTLFSLLAVGFVLSLGKEGYHSRISQVVPVIWNRVVVKRDLSLHAVASVGGFRIPVLYVGYRSLGQNYAMGRGVASWLTDFNRVSRSCGVYLDDFPLIKAEKKLKVVKPNAYAATVAFDTGIIGLILLMLFFVLFVSKPKIPKNPFVTAVTTAIYFESFFRLTMAGLITLPMPWLGLCYVYHLKHFKREDQVLHHDDRRIWV